MLRKATGKAPGLVSASLWGTCFALVWTLAAAIFIAWLVDREILLPERIGYGSMAALFTGAVLGALVSGGKAGHMRTAAAAVTAAAYFLILLATNAMFFGGQYRGVGISLVVILAGTAGATFLSGKGRGGAGRRKYKIPRV